MQNKINLDTHNNDVYEYGSKASFFNAINADGFINGHTEIRDYNQAKKQQDQDDSTQFTI